MHTTPKIGSTITVVVRAHPYKPVWVPQWNAYTSPGPETKTYTGVVQTSDSWMSKDQFNLTTGLPNFPVRTITMKDVVSINGAGVAEQKEDLRVVKVSGSKVGSTYDVTIRDGVAEHCTCDGFRFRRSCRHLKEAV